MASFESSAMPSSRVYGGLVNMAANGFDHAEQVRGEVTMVSSLSDGTDCEDSSLHARDGAVNCPSWTPGQYNVETPAGAGHRSGAFQDGYDFNDQGLWNLSHASLGQQQHPYEASHTYHQGLGQEPNWGTMPQQHQQHHRGGRGYPSSAPCHATRSSAQPSATAALRVVQSAGRGAPPQTRGKVYKVQFKCTVRFFTSPQATPTVGDFVVVEADRGEDLGIVTEILSMQAFIHNSRGNYMDEEETAVMQIIRIAGRSELRRMPDKVADEQDVLQYAMQLADNKYQLPLCIVDAEYQFDRRKLTIFYQADGRVDFRDLVRDLFATFKARIWMKKLSLQDPPLDANAQMALASGMHFSMGSNSRGRMA